MNIGADKSEPLTAIHTDLGAIFVSLELSRSSWLITSLSPGGGEKMSKHSVPGGDFAGLRENGVVVITGAGRAFCAGGDVGFMADLIERRDTEEFSRLLGSARP